MKKFILALTLVGLALGMSVAQKTSNHDCACKDCLCEVTAEKIAQQSASKPFLIEPGKGMVYQLAPGIDYSRVHLRTSAGERSVSNLVKALGTPNDPILLGAFSDMSVRVFGQKAGDAGGFNQIDRSGVSGAKRDGPTWGCKGYKDCNDLDRSGLCFGGSNGMSCNPKTHSCVCLAKD